MRGISVADIILAITIIVIIVAWIFSKKHSKKLSLEQEKRFEDFLASLEMISIDLDKQLQIDGFHWQEDVIVDRENNQLHGFENELYTIGGIEFVNRFHKFDYYRHGSKTQFCSKLYFNFEYKNQTFDLNFNLPIEHTKLRMKCYLEKEMKVYIFASENTKLFLFDFIFLEEPYSMYVPIRNKDLERMEMSS